MEPAVFAQDEGIVEARDKKNVMHLERHQVFEAFKAFFGVQNRFGAAAAVHGDILVQICRSKKRVGVRMMFNSISSAYELSGVMRRFCSPGQSMPSRGEARKAG